MQRRKPKEAHSHLQSLHNQPATDGFHQIGSFSTKHALKFLLYLMFDLSLYLKI